MSVLSALASPFRRYAQWIHLGFPEGTVEPRPEVNPDGSTAILGVYVAGDLSQVPLLKFAIDSGAKTARKAVEDRSLPKADHNHLDLVILGAGAAGVAAGLEAKKQGLNFKILEGSSRAFHTIADFPKGKPIYTYPVDMEPAGDLTVEADVKEPLLEELDAQVAKADLPLQTDAMATAIKREGGHLRVEMMEGDAITAHAVIIAIGTSGNYRTLEVPGEEKKHKVYNRLHDPADFAGQQVLVVGGGDSALEAAVALAEADAAVSLSYRKESFSRPKPDNIDRLMERANGVAKPGSIKLLMASNVTEIGETEVTLSQKGQGEPFSIKNDVVFTLIGREAPLGFFRRSGIPISGEWTPTKIASLVAFLILMVFLYHWKAGGALTNLFSTNGWFPFNIRDDEYASNSLIGIIFEGLAKPGFYYTFLYSACVVVFGVMRIRRRKTPYITIQTLALMAIQVLPLFLLPEIILPYLGRNELLPEAIKSNLFMNSSGGEEYWRAYGLILAWPLFIWNVFTSEPNWWWLAISFAQTFVIIPGMIYFWGKGAYCGWICTCGALAETMGDQHRHKMPHGPKANRLNLAGQVILAVAMFLFVLRVASWLNVPHTGNIYYSILGGGWSLFGTKAALNYSYVVDTFLAGIIGVGLYFWFSGRVWCRFFCPLAALMHIYHKFSTFRILADKKKCISCNICTSVCHQGIDVMSYANKGKPMDDVECVRCSACVQSCPTGVLSFGRVDASNNVIAVDSIEASSARLLNN